MFIRRTIQQRTQTLQAHWRAPSLLTGARAQRGIVLPSECRHADFLTDPFGNDAIYELWRFVINTCWSLEVYHKYKYCLCLQISKATFELSALTYHWFILYLAEEAANIVDLVCVWTWSGLFSEIWLWNYACISWTFGISKNKHKRWGERYAGEMVCEDFSLLWVVHNVTFSRNRGCEVNVRDSTSEADIYIWNRQGLMPWSLPSFFWYWRAILENGGCCQRERCEMTVLLCFCFWSFRTSVFPSLSGFPSELIDVLLLLKVLDLVVISFCLHWEELLFLAFFGVLQRGFLAYETSVRTGQPV